MSGKRDELIWFSSFKHGLLCRLLLCLALPAAVFSKYDPGLRFRTIKTKNFYVHFHQGQEERAQAMAELAEQKHALLITQIRHKPYFRTHLVLSDISDAPNGFASFEPWNRIEMFAARPLPDSVIGNYLNWDDLLFTHEYNHTLTLDQIYGLPAISRYLFGRVWFPNTNQPAWIIEGSAVAEESADGFGRNNSPIVEMYFRAEAEGLDLKSINRASVPVRDWPAGNVHYLYGGRFAAWLQKKYPGKDLNAIHRENADNVWPYLNNTNSNDVFGEKFTVLWDEWLEELGKEQLANLRRLEAEGVTPLTRLTTADFYQTFPRFMGAHTLYFLRQNNYERASLQSISLTGKSIAQKVQELNAPHFLTIRKNSPYVIDLEYYRSFSLYSDLHDVLGNRQLTERLRAVSVDTMPSGDLLLVTQEAGLFSLGIHDGTGKHKETLLGPTTRTLAHARVSPAGDSLVFTARDATTAANHLYLLSLKNRELVQLTREKTTDLHPAFSPDGRSVVFSSDRNGVFNLHEIQIDAREMRRLTHLTGGAFYPDYSPDGGSIALSEFAASGYRIALYDRKLAPVERIKVSFGKIKPDTFALPQKKTIPVESKPYSVLPSILPSSWSPLLSFDSRTFYGAGVSLFGADTLWRDFVGLSVFQDIYTETTSAMVAYENSRYYPDFYVAPYLSAGNNCGGICSAGGYAGVLVPFIKFYQRQFLYLTGRYFYDRSWGEQYGAGLLGYSYNTTQVFSRSISPENGRRIGLSTTVGYQRFTDYFAYTETRLYSMASYAEYLPGFFRNNVLMARAMWVHSWDIGSGITFSRPSTSYLWGSAPLLRGYSLGFAGQGLLLGTLEYRFPIFQPDWGFFRVPFFFRDFYGKLFTDASQAYFQIIDRPVPIQRSAGAEIGLANIFGYRYLWSAYIGYARGFDQGGEHQVYFGILGFTGVLWSKYSPHGEFN